MAAYGQPLPAPSGGLTHLFPTVETLAEASLEAVGMPHARRNTLHGLCAALAGGSLMLDAGTDRQETEERLVGLNGIGAWTAGTSACARPR